MLGEDECGTILNEALELTRTRLQRTHRLRDYVSNSGTSESWKPILDTSILMDLPSEETCLDRNNCSSLAVLVLTNHQREPARPNALGNKARLLCV